MRTPLAGQLEPMRPRGPQCFVDWRYVRAGFVGWYSGNNRVAVWDPDPANTRGVPAAPHGIRLQAQPAQTIGPIIPRDRPWEYIYHISTVIHDEGVYRVWYECVPSDHFSGHRLQWPVGHGNVLCYAESDDGFTWRKPNLGIATYHDQPQTNIVYGRELSPNGFHGGGVFKDPHAPPSERYKLIYIGLLTDVDAREWIEKFRQRFGEDQDPMCFRTGRGQARLLQVSGHLDRSRTASEDSDELPRQIHVMAGAVSPDGFHWTPLDDPLMVHFSDTLNTASWDSGLGRYVGYFRTWRYGRRCVGRAETSDFRHWPATPDTVLQASLEAHPSDDVYTNAKVVYPGSTDTHLMFPAIYHRFDDSREVHLASSVDGVNWQWVPGGPVVTRGLPGAWNGGDVAASLGLVQLGGDRIGVPITGYAHPHKYPRGGEPPGSPGWATWPKGRLSALCCDEQGEFSTPGLIFDGTELSLNVEPRESGEVIVELKDETGQPIPGHSFADADPIVANSLDHRVSWHGHTAIGEYAGKPITLAFRLRRTSLFAFEFI